MFPNVAHRSCLCKAISVWSDRETFPELLFCKSIWCTITNFFVTHYNLIKNFFSHKTTPLFFRNCGISVTISIIIYKKYMNNYNTTIFSQISHYFFLINDQLYPQILCLLDWCPILLSKLLSAPSFLNIFCWNSIHRLQCVDICRVEFNVESLSTAGYRLKSWTNSRGGCFKYDSVGGSPSWSEFCFNMFIETAYHPFYQGSKCFHDNLNQSAAPCLLLNQVFVSL